MFLSAEAGIGRESLELCRFTPLLDRFLVKSLVFKAKLSCQTTVPTSSRYRLQVIDAFTLVLLLAECSRGYASILSLLFCPLCRLLESGCSCKRKTTTNHPIVYCTLSNLWHSLKQLRNL